MKLESLVIVNQHVTVNDLSNFAHTAHHARRVVSAGNLLGSNFLPNVSVKVSLSKAVSSEHSTNCSGMVYVVSK